MNSDSTWETCVHVYLDCLYSFSYLIEEDPNTPTGAPWPTLLLHRVGMGGLGYPFQGTANMSTFTVLSIGVTAFLYCDLKFYQRLSNDLGLKMYMLEQEVFIQICQSSGSSLNSAFSSV